MKKAIAVFMVGCSLHATADDVVIYKPSGGVMVVPGFHTYAANGYTPAEKNIALLRELKKTATPIKLTNFSSSSPGNNYLVCRASYPVYAPNKTAFESFIEGALKTELSQTGLEAEDSPRQIQGRLDEIDFSSFGSGKWVIQATFTVAGKEPLVVKHEYPYQVSGGAVAACGDVANALVPAVQSFLYAVYSNPRFVELVQ